MLESLLELLFKIRPVAWSRGSFDFETARPLLLLMLSLTVAALAAAAYWRRSAEAGPRRTGTLIGLRWLTLLLLTVALLRPVIRVSTASPGDNFLAVLIDDSQSMRLADTETSRGAQALDLLNESGALVERLSSRFTVRTYRFSDQVQRTALGSPLEFDGRATDLSAALHQVRQELTGVPLAGMVVVTDGADSSGLASDGSHEAGSDSGLDEELLQLASRRVPVYALGLGEENFRRDLELDRLESPKRVLKGSSFAVDATVTQQGYDGETVRLNVERDGALLAERNVTFERGTRETTVRFHLKAEDAGPQAYRFTLQAGEGEQVTENNAREVLVMAEDRREKILYFEGEPRFEVAFLRRAIADDDHLQLVVLLRSAENKLLRLGVDDPLELVSGFPTTREELFTYRGLILGNVEASYFTSNQLRILEEFVSQRGGGLLLLGGRASFTEGGFLGTPLEDLSPLVLNPAPQAFFAEVKVAATEAGRNHAALQLSVDSPTDPGWRDLPALSMRNSLTQAKPGATVLLTGTPTERSPATNPTEDLIVLASQRYGRGRVTAFPVQDSWHWQMDASVPLEDQTHERFWQQLLRWLVSTTPRQVELEASSLQPTPGGTVELRTQIRDGTYLGINGARVQATVLDPIGQEFRVPLTWTLEEDGEYRGTFATELAGPYEVQVTAEAEGETIGEDQIQLNAAEHSQEFFRAEMNAPLLRRIAEETGGRFYTSDNADALADDARYTESGKTVIEAIELWDMPIVLLALLTSISAEWLLRRRWGWI